MRTVRVISVLLGWVLLSLTVLVPSTEAQSASASGHWRTIPQGRYTVVRRHRHYRYHRRYHRRHFHYHRHAAAYGSLSPAAITLQG